jgi:hypothetical protein
VRLKLNQQVRPAAPAGEGGMVGACRDPKGNQQIGHSGEPSVRLGGVRLAAKVEKCAWQVRSGRGETRVERKRAQILI